MRAGRFLISAAAAAALTPGAWALTPAPSLAASSDYLLTIEGVPGESQAAGHGHPETIEIDSWSLGASNPTSVGSSGMSAGKVQVNDFVIMRSVDKASPMLAKGCATGAHYKTVTLSMRKTARGPRQSTSLVMQDVTCTIDTPSAGAPMEQVTFHYGKIEGDVKAVSGGAMDPTPAMRN